MTALRGLWHMYCNKTRVRGHRSSARPMPRPQAVEKGK